VLEGTYMPKFTYPYSTYSVGWYSLNDPKCQITFTAGANIEFIAQDPKPGAISSVTAKAEAGKTTVTWTASENATAYIIQRRVKDAATWMTLKSSVTEPKYVDTTGEGGTVYQYRVRGRDGSNYGPFKVSSVVRAIAGTPTPGAISSVTAKAEAGKITVTWTASENATAYIIQRRVKDDTKWTTLKSSVTELKFEDKTGEAGTIYQYRVRGRNGTVYGPFKLSSVARFVAGVPAPGAIASVTAKAEAGKITVTWTAAANATNYIVERWVGGTWTRVATLGNVKTYTDSTVTAGTQYRYRIMPKNATGSGAKALSPYVKAAASKPGLVDHITGSYDSDADKKPTGPMQLKWGAADGAVSYQLQRQKKTDTNWTTVASGVKGTTYTDTALWNVVKAGEVFHYRIRAYNAAGYGEWKVGGWWLAH